MEMAAGAEDNQPVAIAIDQQPHHHHHHHHEQQNINCKQNTATETTTNTRPALATLTNLIAPKEYFNAHHCKQLSGCNERAVCGPKRDMDAMCAMENENKR